MNAREYRNASAPRGQKCCVRTAKAKDTKVSTVICSFGDDKNSTINELMEIMNFHLPEPLSQCRYLCYVCVCVRMRACTV